MQNSHAGATTLEPLPLHWLHAGYQHIRTGDVFFADVLEGHVWSLGSAKMRGPFLRHSAPSSSGFRVFRLFHASRLLCECAAETSV